MKKLLNTLLITEAILFMAVLVPGIHQRITAISLLALMLPIILIQNINEKSDYCPEFKEEESILIDLYNTEIKRKKLDKKIKKQ